MKRILMLLSFLFFALWVAALFYPERSTGIHLALLVALLFFIRSLMVIPAAVVKKEAQDSTLNNQLLKNQGYNDYNMGTATTTIKQIRPESEKQDAKVLS